MPELVIWMGDRRVGTLDGTDRQRLQLTYDETWADDPTATPVSLSMPLVGGAFRGPALHAYLWGLLPDNDAVIDRWARDFQCAAADVFGLLRGIGADVAGAAAYLDPATSPSDDRGIEPLTDEDVAALIREVAADGAAWHPSGLGRWSLAGAQAKLALARNDATGGWGRPTGTAPTTHILKPAIAGLEHHDLNEHLCLATAGRLGMRAATTRVERIAGEPVLVVDRFDRRVVDGQTIRVHQEDGCQALGIHPARKYQADGGPSIEDLARVTRASTGRRANESVRSLVQAIAYNWLILGVDGHAKNYGFLLSGPQVRLAPLYDVASAAPHYHPRKLKVAQKVAGEYRVMYITRRHWEQLARAVRIDADELIDDIATMAEALPDAYADAAAPLPEVDQKAAAQLRDALMPWVAECREALTA